PIPPPSRPPGGSRFQVRSHPNLEYRTWNLEPPSGVSRPPLMNPPIHDFQPRRATPAAGPKKSWQNSATRHVLLSEAIKESRAGGVRMVSPVRGDAPVPERLAARARLHPGPHRSGLETNMRPPVEAILVIGSPLF